MHLDEQQMLAMSSPQILQSASRLVADRAVIEYRSEPCFISASVQESDIKFFVQIMTEDDQFVAALCDCGQSTPEQSCQHTLAVLLVAQHQTTIKPTVQALDRTAFLAAVAGALPRVKFNTADEVAHYFLRAESHLLPWLDRFAGFVPEQVVSLCEQLLVALDAIARQPLVEHTGRHLELLDEIYHHQRQAFTQADWSAIRKAKYLISRLNTKNRLFPDLPYGLVDTDDAAVLGEFHRLLAEYWSIQTDGGREAAKSPPLLRMANILLVRAEAVGDLDMQLRLLEWRAADLEGMQQAYDKAIEIGNQITAKRMLQKIVSMGGTSQSVLAAKSRYEYRFGNQVKALAMLESNFMREPSLRRFNLWRELYLTNHQSDFAVTNIAVNFLRQRIDRSSLIFDRMTLSKDLVDIYLQSEMVEEAVEVAMEYPIALEQQPLLAKIAIKRWPLKGFRLYTRLIDHCINAADGDIQLRATRYLVELDQGVKLSGSNILAERFASFVLSLRRQLQTQPKLSKMLLSKV
ncbi:MAG: hypothetical protein HWE20_01635 [Gammaproteobacteria bacterium]|nr:hypothetical protein [Gammaproteobacteria bacterium]